MKNKIVMALLFSRICWADNKPYFYEDKLKMNKVEYFTQGNVRISSSKLCRKKKCFAYKLASKQIAFSTQVEWKTGGVNPTSTLCSQIGGEPRVGYLENNNEFSLCYFDDKSFIFAWDLFKI
ncbi:MAG: hypothetical protein ACXVCP_05490 [Bdellovibrio sp.]